MRVLDTKNGPVLVAVASDGAGSAKQGEIGSAIAVEAILEQAAAWFAANHSAAAFRCPSPVKCRRDFSLPRLSPWSRDSIFP